MNLKLVVEYPESATASGGARRTAHMFNQPSITFGRADGNVLTIHDPERELSSEHGRIEQTDDGYVVIDLESLNGTRVNGVELTANAPQPLRKGDLIELGDIKIQFFPLEPGPAQTRVHEL